MVHKVCTLLPIYLLKKKEEKKIVEKEARGLPPLGRNSAAASAFTCTTQQGAVKSRDITRAQSSSSKKIQGGKSIAVAVVAIPAIVLAK